MIHMHIKIFQKSLLYLLLKFILSAFHILEYLDIFMFRYFFCLAFLILFVPIWNFIDSK